jgi:hypothetical protein
MEARRLCDRLSYAPPGIPAYVIPTLPAIIVQPFPPFW